MQPQLVIFKPELADRLIKIKYPFIQQYWLQANCRQQLMAWVYQFGFERFH